MSNSLFMINGNNDLVELTRSPYSSEALFQKLLADHPEVLGHAGGDSKRLLLVRRELPVPEALTSSGRWNLDHLFLDPEGVPVLVEVKRASDTRLRREVVAQMLDYAANGVAYWPLEHLTAAFEYPGNGPDRLREFLGGDDPESFWRRVESNLKAGRVRMVFVADEIPKELRRIVEFLNEQMRPAEILAIEVEHFTGADGLRLLTPRVVGATDRAVAAKAVGPEPPPLTQQEWLETLISTKGEAVGKGAKRILDTLHEEGFVSGLTKAQDSTFAKLALANGKVAWPFFVRRSSGKLETSLQYLESTNAYKAEADRQKLLERLRAVPGVEITTTKLTGWPAIPLDALMEPQTWEAVVAIVRDVKRCLLAEPPITDSDAEEGS